MHHDTTNSNSLPAFTDKALEALSYVIVTATEGGEYTRSDFSCWKKYKHGETDKYFRAEVTVYPHTDIQSLNESPTSADPIRLTPEELGHRLSLRLLDLGPSVLPHLIAAPLQQVWRARCA